MENMYYLAVVVVVIVLVIGAKTIQAVVCSAVELIECTPGTLMGKPPSSVCCRKLMEQRPCFCQFLRDPNLK
ncbi:lipid binding protein, putative [Ricinus communis]|uniref:Lipid binding protein, putative n=1 Tax=Ricinus communis TaxID=3988 RepID=B9SQ12_RICCO|nr:lipid binding protein, putative [Ricinus communis]